MVNWPSIAPTGIETHLWRGPSACQKYHQLHLRVLKLLFPQLSTWRVGLPSIAPTGIETRLKTPSVRWQKPPSIAPTGIETRLSKKCFKVPGGPSIAPTGIETNHKAT